MLNSTCTPEMSRSTLLDESERAFETLPVLPTAVSMGSIDQFRAMKACTPTLPPKRYFVCATSVVQHVRDTSPERGTEQSEVGLRLSRARAVRQLRAGLRARRRCREHAAQQQATTHPERPDPRHPHHHPN
jgi:hypothetical protein